MNIPEVIDQFKGALQRIPEDYITVCILILVSLTSFGLGRLSVLESAEAPVRIHMPEESEASTVNAKESRLPSAARAATAAVGNMESGEVVASKNGTKYHLPWCSGAKRIAAANKISFNSKEEAERAGYTAAANCPGL